jgi:alpha,alpha-trehalose phosphorylase
VITDSRFPVEPWRLRETGLNLELLAQSESIFALSNGHIGLRGNLDEGDPYGLPGTYLNSFYETRPLPYAEAGYGYPESGQTAVNVTDAKLIRLLVDDEPFDMRYGEIVHHERILDLRQGVLHRDVTWCSPAGRQIRVRSHRLVSLTQRAIMAIRYEVQAVDSATRVVVQSELVANEDVPQQSSDPRVAAALSNPLQPVEHRSNDNRSSLVHHCRASGLRMAVAADHVIDGDVSPDSHTYTEENWSRTTVGTRLEAGQRLVLTKFAAYGWSSQRTKHALRDQVDAALSAALNTGWDELLNEQSRYLDEFWDGADVDIQGDETIQQAVRFALFHVLQAGARAEQRAIPAKGLTGPGYDGHTFWDTENYVLPVLIATAPRAAADALRWRHSTIELAEERARTLHLEGAAFPWRTIRGQECSAYWPAGTAAFHVNSDIALAADRYVSWTGDDAFERSHALPLLIQTARLWASLGYSGDDGRFHIDGVTGPDEYSAIVDDNTYTNLMAARNLLAAADVAQRWPDDALRLDVTDDETRRWRAAADSISVPYDDERQMPQQDRGSTHHQRWDFAETARDGRYPLLLHYAYVGIYRKQVVKQADLVLAMHWCGDAFTLEEKARAFSYYEELTVRDSSLSACSQAILAAEVGHLDLAHEYLQEAALMDLRDLEHNTRDGLHVASLAGAWLGVVCGYGGLRDHGGRLRFAPRLPAQIHRLAFTIRWRGDKVRVEITPKEATYTLEAPAGSSVELSHHGTFLTVGPGSPVTRAIPDAVPLTPRPTQPAGRRPGAALATRA